MNMNRIIITGRLTKDPELKTTNSGTELAELSVAVDRRKKDQNGEKVTDFFDITAWGKTGVFCQTYFQKGDGITIEGRMESRKYQDKEGKNRIAWAIVADQVEFPLGKKAAGASGAGANAAVPDPSQVDGDLPF
jgi:single-strand DNA-binding protein